MALALAGCGGSDDDGGRDGGTVAAPTETQGTTTDGTDGIDPLDDAGLDPVTGEPEQDGTALLERVEVARHEGFDRVVFEFRDHLPGYRVEYQEPPLTQDGSGAIVELEGTSLVVVRMEPASGFDLTTGEGELVYTGPRRFRGAEEGTSVVTDVVRSGDFEAVLTWGVGLSSPVDFRVLTLQDPPRLVVDFRNH